MPQYSVGSLVNVRWSFLYPAPDGLALGPEGEPVRGLVVVLQIQKDSSGRNIAEIITTRGSRGWLTCDQLCVI